MKKNFALFFMFYGLLVNAQASGYVEYEYTKNLGVETNARQSI